MRTAVQAVALVFVCLFAFGTVYWLATEGPDVIGLLGVLVLAVLGFGIFGALSG